jgi:hypothetical protein
MSTKLLQLNFAFTVSADEYAAAVTPLAEAFADVKGMVWKIWIINAQQRGAGGIYLFEDQASLGDFLDGPLVAQVRAHPALRDLSAKVFDVMEAPTRITRGPVHLGAGTA